MCTFVINAFYCNPVNIDVVETDIKYQMELCQLQAIESYKSKKETGAGYSKCFKEKNHNLGDLGFT